MAFPIEEQYILAAEKQLNLVFPTSFKNKIMIENVDYFFVSLFLKGLKFLMGQFPNYIQQNPNIPVTKILIKHLDPNLSQRSLNYNCKLNSHQTSQY